MNSIWKFQLEIKDRQEVLMPGKARILSVQMQHSVPCLWALVDTASPRTYRNIAIYGTGSPAPDDCGEFIATVQMADGALVWHVFDCGEIE